MARLLAAALFILAPAAAPAQARDHDELPDRWERKHHLNLKRNDARRDRDRDGLSNFREYRAHTNPRKKDSDRDGLRDRAEIRYGFNPRDRDSDDDDTKDGRENAGKVKRVSGSSITIRLAAGGRLTARLGDGLAAACPPAATDDSPPAESDPVDDTAEDPGDDPESDEGDEPELPDADAAQPEDDPGDDASFDDAAFDRQFEADFSAGQECGTSVLKQGTLIHEATVDRSGPSPMLTAVELVAR